MREHVEISINFAAFGFMIATIGLLLANLPYHAIAMGLLAVASRGD